MLQINGKTFMNLQEAVQWLLDNNALPFQSSANYVANTEIGMGTIVNPSPAKVRIGSLIFFADSKVSTVIGLTENGFICSDQYNNLVDDIAYVTGVSINGSGHLITTLSDGQTIDAGIVKQVNNFSISDTQHLIAHYNDGTSTDLGAIFSGNISIAGNLTVSGGISGNAITGNSIIENMVGYSWAQGSNEYTAIYVGVCKNGNKITMVVFGSVKGSDVVTNNTILGRVTIPNSIGAQLYPNTYGSLTNVLDMKEAKLFVGLGTQAKTIKIYCQKESNVSLVIGQYGLVDASLDPDLTYLFRYECTFLLSNNLA